MIVPATAGLAQLAVELIIFPFASVQGGLGVSEAVVAREFLDREL